MPSLVRYFIKTSMIYLVLTLLIGVLMTVRNVLKIPMSIAGLFPVYIHLLVIGWLTQLIFGVAYWMFPKYTREKPRANVALAWSVYFLLNVGLLLRAIAEPWHARDAGDVSGVVLVLSATLQGLAAFFFVVNSWGRIKER